MRPRPNCTDIVLATRTARKPKEVLPSMVPPATGSNAHSMSIHSSWSGRGVTLIRRTSRLCSCPLAAIHRFTAVRAALSLSS